MRIVPLMKGFILFFISGLLSIMSLSLMAAQTNLTLIHLSDTHGKFVPHWEKFADGQWHANSGGFAKIYTTIKNIRQSTPHPSLLMVNGDNFQGSAEIFFTRGRAVVPILNQFGIDAYTPGNWDFADGPVEFRARFVGSATVPKQVTFPVLAAGVYNAEGAPAGEIIGARLLPPYMIKDINGLKVAIIGLNDDKPLDQAVVFTTGLKIEVGWNPLNALLKEVRAKGANFIVLMSEAGLAQNLAIARDYRGINIILSGDTHEELYKPIVDKKNGTIIVESGEGSHVGQLDLLIDFSANRAAVLQYNWKLHEVNENVIEDVAIKTLVDQQRAEFLSGPAFKPHVRSYPGWAPGTGLVLNEPLDKVVGTTDSDLARNNVIESIGDQVIANAMRELTGADIGTTNGFRYDIPLPAGQPITVGDVFHWLPLGAHVVTAEMTGGQLKDRMERFVTSVFDPNPYRRGGGWLPRLSGVRFYLDLTGPIGPASERIIKAEVFNKTTSIWETLVEDKIYTIASCHTPGDPLDHTCRTSGARNMKFLLSDGSLVPPLVPHQNPNPLPKLKVAPDNVVSAPEALRKYLGLTGGVVGANHTASAWVISKGSLPISPLAPNVVQPLTGSGPDWLAAERVAD